MTKLEAFLMFDLDIQLNLEKEIKKIEKHWEKLNIETESKDDTRILYLIKNEKIY